MPAVAATAGMNGNGAPQLGQTLDQYMTEGELPALPLLS